MFHQTDDSAMGAVTWEHASPNNMIFGGRSCIMSKNNFVPTAMSHYKTKPPVSHACGVNIHGMIGVRR